MANFRGEFQGYIMGDAGSYAVYRDEQGQTLGYAFDKDRSTDEPDFVGTVMELRRLAHAKVYTRGSSFAPYA